MHHEQPRNRPKITGFCNIAHCFLPVCHNTLPSMVTTAKVVLDGHRGVTTRDTCFSPASHGACHVYVADVRRTKRHGNLAVVDKNTIICHSKPRNFHSTTLHAKLIRDRVWLSSFGFFSFVGGANLFALNVKDSICAERTNPWNSRV